MTTPTPQHWMVTCWPEGSCRYQVLSVHVSRDDAVAAAARHPRAQLVFRAVPTPTPKPTSEF